jgi:hypothetical protein
MSEYINGSMNSHIDLFSVRSLTGVGCPIL